MKIFKVILLSFLGLLFNTNAGAQNSIDFTVLSLSIQPDTNTEEIFGKVKLAYIDEAFTDSIYLNGIKMNYINVLLNGLPVKYDSDDKGIWLKPDSAVLTDTNFIDITYSCRPRKGIYFIGWQDESGKGKRQIWTQGQGIDHRHWIPHRDEQTDKVVIDIEVIFDSEYDVVSNGILLKKRNLEKYNLTAWHYKMEKPMSSYLIALAIGKYDMKDPTSQLFPEIPLENYYYPEREDDYSYYYYKNEEIFNFLNTKINIDFPWKNYKQIPVQDFRHGAMENTTATIFGDFFMVDEIAFHDRNYTYVNAHELAHQWFGNLVTAENSDHHWLHEGFATYYQWLSEKNLYGGDYFDNMRLQEAELVFQASLMDTIPLGNGKAGTYRFYQKGAWVLYMLNNLLGDEIFQQGIEHFLKKHAYGVVNTDDFQKSMEWAGKTNLDDFFNDWVHTAGEPTIEVAEVEQDEKNILQLRIKQLNFDESTKNIRAFVELVYEDGRREVLSGAIYTPEIDHRYTLKGDLKYWNFDPNENLLAHTQENKSHQMWLAQVKDPQLTDRIEAMENLLKSKEKTDEAFLMEIFQNKKEHYAVRALALQALVVNEDKAANLLQQVFEDDDVQLQKKAIFLVKNDMTQLQSVLMNLALTGKSYELRENALHMSVRLGKVPEEWLNNKEFDLHPGIPGKKVKIASLIYRYLLYSDEEAAENLISYTSPAHDFMTRINAIQATNILKLRDEVLTENLFDAYFNTNWKLSKEARLILSAMFEDKKDKKLIDKYIHRNAGNLQDFQKQMLKRTFDLNIN